MKPGDMLEILYEAEHKLPFIFTRDYWTWHSLLIDYQLPVVRRVWSDFCGHRLYLHEIEPCAVEDALMHPHPWPSAIKVLEGSYEMGVGYGKGQEVPPVAARMRLAPGSEYEMIEPDGWHYVRPIVTTSLSIMVTGEPWDRPFDVQPKRPLRELAHSEVGRILDEFRRIYNETR